MLGTLLALVKNEKVTLFGFSMEFENSRFCRESLSLEFWFFRLRHF